MNPIIHLLTTIISLFALLNMTSNAAYTSPASTGTVASSFPHPTLTPIATSTTEPTYSTLRIAQTQLNANATSIHSNAGDGIHGHIVLVLPPAEFAVLAEGAVFEAPDMPPENPIHAAVENTEEFNECNCLHKASLVTFRTYHDMDKALRNQIIAATPECYIDELSSPTLGFAGVTCLQLLTHLWTTYGEITPAKLDENEVRMKAPWGPPTPVETLFTQLDKGVAFATAGGDITSEQNTMRLGYNNIYATGLFTKPCHAWRAMPTASQTLVAFKKHFKQADKDRRLTTTVASAGYHGANTAIVPTTKTSNAPHPSTATTNTNTSARSYCWTHGSIKNLQHSSETCKNKAEGHKDEATSDNKLGGSTKVWAGREKA